MLTFFKLQLVISLLLTYISQLTAGQIFGGRLKPLPTVANSFSETREATFVKNAAKNDKVFRCLNSLWYIVYGEEHAWDFIKGRNPDDFVHTSKANKMISKIQTLVNSFDIPIRHYAHDYCRKHHFTNWKCKDCTRDLYQQMPQELLRHAYLGPLKYGAGLTYIQKDCAQFKKLRFGKCEILLAFLLFCPKIHENTLLHQEKATCFGYCDHQNPNFDYNMLYNICHNKTGIDMRIFRHGEKDLDYLRKFQAENICPGVTNLPYIH